MGNIDWAKLYEGGRCKNYGVPWSEVEANACFTLGIPAEYVRRGCIIVESYKEMLAEDTEETERTGTIPLTQCKKEHLQQLCREYKINFTDEATRLVLIDELKSSGCPNQVAI